MERLKKVFINLEATIKQALKQMDAMGEKTLLVVDEQNTLLGTLTDGDVRRWMLEGKSLTQGISNAMNVKPISVKEDFDKETVKQLMVKKKLDCLPIVDDHKRVVQAVWWTDLFEKGISHRKKFKVPVVIMAGGEGARLAPFTKILPKPLMPIGEKPIVEHIIDRFTAYGCNNFYLSVNYKSNIIKAFFSDFDHPYKISYVEEKQPLGTAGGLHFLKNKIKNTFFISNCDILIDADYADILKFHKEGKYKLTLVCSMKHFVIPYGVCEIEHGGILKSVQEKPEYDFFVSTGMYVMEKSVLKDIPKGKPYHMTDLIADYLSKDKKIGVYPISEKSWLDMGQVGALQEMLNKFEVKA
jgi:dTDP-glucose pyrophosphorylase